MYSHQIRTQAYELVALFSNLPHWVDMYEAVSELPNLHCMFY